MLTEPTLNFGVSEFVALVNQTLDYAFTGVTITGELANLRVSKGKWLYFDLKDEATTIKCFGTVYHLPGPLEDGMLLRVAGSPRLHQQYGFSFNLTNIQLAGEGTIRRAAALLQAQLTAEGLFAEERKRLLPYPPARIGLVTSSQSAAYADFIKILATRWGGLAIELIDVQVQGEIAPTQLAHAIEHFNVRASPPEVLVIIRGGGSAEDLAAFSSEIVTRAVAASRIPTLVAIGHESDTSLAELAADRRASTPSNAAELLVPDRRHVHRSLLDYKHQLDLAVESIVRQLRQKIQLNAQSLDEYLPRTIIQQREKLKAQAQILAAYDPQVILKRGYAIMRVDGQVVIRAQQLSNKATLQIEISDAVAQATLNSIIAKKGQS